MVFVEQEGTQSSLLGVGEVIEQNGLFCSLYTDRGSHYWTTPEADGKVDKTNLTQFGNAMKALGIGMKQLTRHKPVGDLNVRLRPIRVGFRRSLLWRVFGTGAAQRTDTLRKLTSPGSMPNLKSPHGNLELFFPYIGGNLRDILCESFERTVGKDNGVQFERLSLQIPQDQQRYHYVKAKVKVTRLPTIRNLLIG